MAYEFYVARGPGAERQAAAARLDVLDAWEALKAWMMAVKVRRGEGFGGGALGVQGLRV